ncbi:MAG: FtsX-like permease family protein [Rubricella sp.]
MWRAAFSALFSHWRRRPVQLAALVTGLALATALWTGVQAINAEARASYDRAAATLGQDRLETLTAEGPIPDETYIALRRAGWLVSPVVEGEIRLRGGARVRVVGFDPLTAPVEAGLTIGTVETDFLEFITPPGRALAAPETLERIGEDTRPLPPIDAIEGIAPGIVAMDHGIARDLLRAEGASRLLVAPEHPRTRAPLETVAPGLTLDPPQEDGDLARLTDSFHLNLTAFGFLSFAVGLFIVHGTVGLAFEQRRGMVRTLRAIGLPASVTVAAMAAELLVLALIAGGIGVLGGGLIAAFLLPDVAASLRGLYGAEVTGALTLRPEWWAVGLGIALAGTAVASAGALWRVARLPLLAPAQPRAWAVSTGRTVRLQAGVGALLLSVAAWLVMTGEGLVAGFLLLGALLTGAALLLPGIVAVILSALSRLARGPLAEWFWADTRQQLPGLSLALMALLLALGANIGVGTMVQSFRATFTGWLDQRLASELYVTARDNAEAEELRAFLEPRADAVLPIWHVETEVNGLPTEVFGVIDHTTYRANWPLLTSLPAAWDRVADGTGAMVSEQLARRFGFAPGEEITLPGWDRFTVAGVYSDYGNPIGQVIVSNARLVAQHPDIDRLNHGVRIAPDAAEALANDLRERFGYGERNLIDQAALKAFSLQVFERTFAVTDALSVLTLGVAAVAILTSLVTLASMRLPQLAPVWALGMTRAALGRLEMWRTVALAAMTVLLALPVGLVLAWVLLAVVNVEAFGWRLPMRLFPLDWLSLFALALLAAALAAWWPMRRIARMEPATLVKVFSDER